MMKESGKGKSRPLDKPERKHRQIKQKEELNKSVTLFEGFASSSPIGLYIVQGGKFQYVNPMFEEILGYDNNALIGTDSLNYVYPEDREVVKANAVRMLKGKRIPGFHPYEYRVICKSGEPKWVMETVVPITYQGKQATLGNFMDITERKRIEHILQKEKAFTESIIATAQTIILVLDKEGYIIEFNPYMAEISGYGLDEVRGKDWFNIFLPENVRTRVREVFNKAINDIQTKGNINPILTKDGRELYIKWYDKTLKNAGGSVIGILAIGQDITESRQIEGKLADSEIRYRRLFETAQDAILILNGDTGQIIDANPFIKNLLGYSFEELLGKNLWEIGELKDTLASKISYEQLHKSGYVRYDHLPLVTKDGRQIAVEVVANAYLVNHTKVIQCNIRDITERRQTETALEETQSRLEEAHRLAHIGVWDWDAVSDTVTWSKELYNIAGLDPALPAPTYAQHPKVYTSESFARLSEAVDVALKKGEVYQLELEMVRPDGTHRWVYAFGGPKYSEDGKTIGLIGTVQDITERKNAEISIKESRQELRNLYRRLQTLREEERTQVSSVLHDELGQAMTALKMDLSWIAKRLPKGELTLLGKIASMSELTDTVSETVRRISSELRPGLLDDLGLVAAIEWQTGEFAKRSGFNYHCAFSSPDININKEKSTAIFRILQELLTNVNRHARATEVMVSLAEKGDIIELKVIDNGIGIAEEAINSNKSFGLIGIRERANAFGGYVTITGIPGNGTTVTIQVPLED